MGKCVWAVLCDYTECDEMFGRGRVQGFGQEVKLCQGLSTELKRKHGAGHLYTHIVWGMAGKIHPHRGK